MRIILIAFMMVGLLNSACGPQFKEQPLVRDHSSQGLSDLALAKAITDNLDAETACPQSDRTPDKVTIYSDTDAPYKDLNREIKDLGTDFIVNEFFNTPETLFNFLRLVYERLDTMVKTYRAEKRLPDDAVVFIFKGGNVMRMVANQVFQLVPPDAATILKDRYAEFFKRSDADFSILVDQKKLRRRQNYNAVMDDLTKRAYETLNSIRNEITQNPDLYSNFLQLNTKIAGERLGKYFANLKKLESLKDKENENWFGAKFRQLQLQEDRALARGPVCQYEGQNDYLYEWENADKKKIIGIPLNRRGKWIMNTINKALEWPSGLNPKDLIKFYLVRSKVQFEYTYSKDGTVIRKPIGGELIDVSFPHRDDFRLAAFFRNLKTGIADYKITLDETGESIVVKAESVSGLANDVREVLFEQFPRPWEASKYVKRINRLFFFGIIDMLGSLGVGSPDAEVYINDILDLILKPMENVLPMSNDSKHLALKAHKAVEELSKHYPEMPIINRFFAAVDELVSHRFFNSPKENDEAEFKEMVKVIKENLEIIRALSKLPARTIDTSKIYDASMKSIF